MPYVLMARVSPATGRANDGHSLTLSINALERHAHGKEVRARVACGPLELGEAEVPGWQYFRSESAGDELTRRPGLLHAISCLQRGDTLLCEYPDRLVRSVFLHEAIKRDVAKVGARIDYVVLPSDQDTPETALVRNLFAALAEYDRAQRAVRTRRGKIAKRAEGKPWGGEPPLGMRYTETGGLELDDGECRVLDEVTSYMCDGISLRAIRARCASPRGGRFSFETLAKIRDGDLHHLVKERLGMTP